MISAIEFVNDLGRLEIVGPQRQGPMASGLTQVADLV
jgi:hypothetical protein